MKTKRVLGYTMMIIGFLVIIINALGYLFDWGLKSSPLVIMGIVFLAIGAKTIRETWLLRGGGMIGPKTGRRSGRNRVFLGSGGFNVGDGGLSEDINVVMKEDDNNASPNDTADQGCENKHK